MDYFQSEYLDYPYFFGDAIERGCDAQSENDEQYANGGGVGDFKTGDWTIINGRKTKILNAYTDKAFGEKTVYKVTVPQYPDMKRSPMTTSIYIKDEQTGELRKIQRSDYVMENGGGVSGLTEYDLREGEEYKYLHEPNTTVLFKEKSGNTFTFTDKKDGAWINVSKDELASSVSIKNPSEFRKTVETIIMDNILNNEVSVEVLQNVLNREPNYPHEFVGAMKLEKCFLRPYYRIVS